MVPDPHLMIATAVLGAMLLGAIAMMVDMHLHPRCPECYHCRKAAETLARDRAEKAHIDYHTWTDHRPWACEARDCPGRPKPKS